MLNARKTELPSILPFSVKQSPDNKTAERKKFDPFKPASNDFFQKRGSEARVGLCAPELEISMDRKQESMVKVKIMKGRTSRRQTIQTYR
jgi:hypothetical protein